MTKIAYLALGSNLGNKIANLQNAVNQLQTIVGNVTKCSSVYQSKAVGFMSKNTFLNLVLALETSLSAAKLLYLCQQIERDCGRIKKSTNGCYSDRTLDIDILTFSNEVIQQSDLSIPHPKMTERDFVLIPLVEIAPNEVHPVEKKTYLELNDNLKSSSSLQKTDFKIFF